MVRSTTALLLSPLLGAVGGAVSMPLTNWCVGGKQKYTTSAVRGAIVGSVTGLLLGIVYVARYSDTQQ